MEAIQTGTTAKRLNFGNVLSLLKKNLALILIFIAIGGAVGGCIGNWAIKTSYSSGAKIMIKINSTNKNDSSITGYNEYQIATKIITACASFMNNDLVANDVNAELTKKGLNLPQRDIIKGLKYTIDENQLSVILTYTSYNKNATAILQQIIDSSIAILSEKDESGEWVYGTLANRILVTTAPGQTYNDNSAKFRKSLIIGAACGLALSIALVIFMYLMDDTYRSKQQIEQDTGLSMLAYIEDINYNKEFKK